MKQTIDKKELLNYELPSISEFIWFNWGQAAIAWYTARKVNKKIKRYKKRKKREKFIKNYLEF